MYPLCVFGVAVYLYCSHAYYLATIIVLYCELQELQAFVNCWKEMFQICKPSMLFSDTNPLRPSSVFLKLYVENRNSLRIFIASKQREL